MMKVVYIIGATNLLEGRFFQMMKKLMFVLIEIIVGIEHRMNRKLFYDQVVILQWFYFQLLAKRNRLEILVRVRR